MRIGFFGGTFDPVHNGHLGLAREIRELAALDLVTFIPAHRAPHKMGRRSADGHHRANMLRCALEDDEHLTVDRRELDREGPSFTVDTMRELRAEHPDDDLYFLIGMDSLKDLPTWYRIEELSRLVTFLVAGRPGYESNDAEKILAGSPVRYEIFDTTAVPVSSSELRHNLARGFDTGSMLPRKVLDYIAAEGLYRTTY